MDKQERQLNRCINREYSEGRSFLSRIVDALFSFTGIFSAVTAVIWSLGIKLIPSAVIGLSAVAIFAMTAIKIDRAQKSKLKERLVEEERIKKATEDLLISGRAEKVIIDSLNLKGTFFGGGVFKGDELILARPLYPSSEYTCERLLGDISQARICGAKRLRIITGARVSGEARLLAKRYNVSFSKKEIDDALKRFMPSRDEGERLVIERIKAKRISREEMKKSIFGEKKAKSWAIGTVMLFLWGMIFKKSLPCFAAAGICASLSVYNLIFSSKRTEEKE